MTFLRDGGTSLVDFGTHLCVHLCVEIFALAYLPFASLCSCHLWLRFDQPSAFISCAFSINALGAAEEMFLKSDASFACKKDLGEMVELWAAQRGGRVKRDGYLFIHLNEAGLMTAKVNFQR